jgi:hypothetical protein
MDQVHQAISSGILTICLAVVTAVVSITGLLISLGVNKVTTYLKSKMDPNELSLMKGTATTIVKNLEQSPAFQKLDGPAKKEQAILDFTNWANKNGASVTPAFVDALIEEAVADFNIAIGKYSNLQVLQPFVDKLEAPTPAS